MTSKFEKLIFLLTLFAVMAVAFVFRFIPFNATPYAVGQDAYFHIIQSQSLLNSGKTHSPDFSLTPYLYSGFFKLIGNWETAQKLFLALLCSILSGLAFLLAIQISRARLSQTHTNLLDGVLLGLLFAVSPAISYIASQFMKQLLSMAIFSAYLLALYQYLQIKINHSDQGKNALLYPVVILILALLTVFSHRLTGLYAMAGLILLATPAILAIGATFGLLLLIAGSVFIPGIFSIFDLARLKDAFTLQPSFYATAQFEFLRFSPFRLIESLFPYTAIILTVAQFMRKNSPPYLIYLGVLVFIGIIPFYQFNQPDLGFRLFIMSIPLSSIILMIHFTEWNTIHKGLLQLSLCAVLLISGILQTILEKPVDSLPYGKYKIIIEKTEHFFQENAINPEMLIVHHGFCFYYTFISGRHTLPFQPEWAYKAENTYRLAYGIENSEIQFYLDRNIPFKPLRMDQNYVLFREDIWKMLLDKAANDPDMKLKLLSVMNPYQKRPLFLQKLKDNRIKTGL